MIISSIREIFNSRLVMLSALAFALTIVFIVFRSSIGFGPILATGLTSYLLVWLTIRGAKQKGSKSMVIAIGYYIMTAAFVLWFISFVFIEFNVVSEGKITEEDRGDYVIVLGAGLKGEEPSVSLSSRLQKASEYLNQNHSMKVIVSGGQGEGENISEAEAMKRYLISSGIQEARIIEEDKSTSTRENLAFSKEILEAFKTPHAHKITVITSDYHAFRTKMIAKSIGLEISVLPSKTPLSVYISGCVREYFAVIDTYLFIRLVKY